MGAFYELYAKPGYAGQKISRKSTWRARKYNRSYRGDERSDATTWNHQEKRWRY